MAHKPFRGVAVYEGRLVGPLTPADDEVMLFGDYGEALKAYQAARAQHHLVTLAVFPRLRARAA